MENHLFNVFDFELSADDMAKIETLNTGKSVFFSHYTPQTVDDCIIKNWRKVLGQMEKKLEFGCM
jgi:diketogulonate reductase-like aldo/keto reductase